ncbi:oxygen-dependent protoporphyrinogen oxidase [Blastocladiella emersonii ATCC 22665]|nr:oxygen-dependent protoporphyrinogen oxidase [Blastocladiella emersonii ATCC 22665]
MSRPRVAILGGGITGLAAAHYVKRALPLASVTVLERSARPGGWIQTERAEVDGKPVLLESGPRTLRPVGLAGAVTVDYLQQLGLEDQLIVVPKSSPSAKNRFLLRNDKIELLPSSLPAVWKKCRDSTSAMHNIGPIAIREVLRRRNPPAAGDESVYDLVARRFSPALAENLVSAIVHGIYANSARILSVEATFPSLARAEREFGSVALGMLRGATTPPPADQAALAALLAGNPDLARLWDRVKGASIYALRDGLESVVAAATKSLDAAGVEVRTETTPTKIVSTNTGLEVHTSTGAPITADHVISAIPAPALAALNPPSTDPAALAPLADMSAVTVAVTNIAFRAADVPRAVLDRCQGFGVLSPLSKGSRTDPHLLGIIFDSAAVPRPDAAEDHVVKFTVMMGGHYFVGLPALPSEAEAARRALDAIRFHLCIPPWTAEPVAVCARIHRDCIPEYAVGHVRRVDAARAALDPRVHLAGAWYRGVGVNDCVRSAWDAARTIAATARV